MSPADRILELERLDHARAALGLRHDLVLDTDARDLAEYLVVAEGPVAYTELRDLFDGSLARLSRAESRLTRIGAARMSGCCALALTYAGREAIMGGAA